MESSLEREKKTLRKSQLLSLSSSAASSVVEEKRERQKVTMAVNFCTPGAFDNKNAEYIDQVVHPLFVRRIAFSKLRIVSSGRSKRYRVGLLRSGSASADLGQYHVSPPQSVKIIGNE